MKNKIISTKNCSMIMSEILLVMFWYSWFDVSSDPCEARRSIMKFTYEMETHLLIYEVLTISGSCSNFYILHLVIFEILSKWFLTGCKKYPSSIGFYSGTKHSSMPTSISFSKPYEKEVWFVMLLIASLSIWFITM